MSHFRSEILTARNKESHNTLPSCCYSLFVTVSVCIQAFQFPQSNSNHPLSSLWAPTHFPQLHQGKLPSYNPNKLQEGLLVLGVQQMEEIISLNVHEISLKI